MYTSNISQDDIGNYSGQNDVTTHPRVEGSVRIMLGLMQKSRKFAQHPWG